MNHDTLQERFMKVARGRKVEVSNVQNFILAPDYHVAFDEVTNCFQVKFTSSGHFEEAYRFIERWIKQHAEKIDGVYKQAPPGYLDLRECSMYWLIERLFDQYMEDFRIAIEKKISSLKSELRNERAVGYPKVESRIEGLKAIIQYLAPMVDEVRLAILSPRTIDYFRSMGFDLLSETWSRIVFKHLL